MSEYKYTECVTLIDINIVYILPGLFNYDCE